MKANISVCFWVSVVNGGTVYSERMPGEGRMKAPTGEVLAERILTAMTAVTAMIVVTEMIAVTVKTAVVTAVIETAVMMTPEAHQESLMTVNQNVN